MTSSLRPLLINCLQAGGLMCVGDAISQKFVEKKESIDFNRNIRFGSIGFFMVGPVLRVWYGFLEKRILIKGSPLKTAAAKAITDQTFLPPVYLASFIVLNSLVQGNPWKKAKEDLKSTYVDILVSNYKLWPVVQFVNFGYVPPNYRILFVQTVAIFWNTYLSWKTNNP